MRRNERKKMNLKVNLKCKIRINKNDVYITQLLSSIMGLSSLLLSLLIWYHYLHFTYDQTASCYAVLEPLLQRLVLLKPLVVRGNLLR